MVRLFELNGFDEQFWPAWFEDVDFCKRLAAAGHYAAVIGQAPAEHEGGYSAAALPSGYFAEIFYENMLRYWEKHGSRAQSLAVGLALIPALALRGAVKILDGLFPGTKTAERAQDQRTQGAVLLRLALRFARRLLSRGNAPAARTSRLLPEEN